MAGFIATYIAPLAFVLSVTMGKEAYDDYKRHMRDREANSQKYLILDASSYDNGSAPDGGPHTRAVPASALRVGDLVLLEKNQRVPADLVLLRTSDASGTCFIRTDQLDGETDWKLRVAVPTCQKLVGEMELLGLDADIYGACFSFFWFWFRASLLGHAMLLVLRVYSGRSDERYPHLHWNIYHQLPTHSFSR